MRLTKIGHCCMLIEENGVRMITDPGAFTAEKHSTLTGIDAILITHEHADHYHLQSLQALLRSNPKAVVICNASVAALLSLAGIAHDIVSDGSLHSVKGVEVQGHGTQHAVIHASLPQAQNTGLLIGGRLWYPGDDLTIDPGVKPAVMALPVAGPWLKLSEALDYAIKLQPTTAFGVHDMILNPLFTGFLPQLVSNVLQSRGIGFMTLDLDKEYDF